MSFRTDKIRGSHPITPKKGIKEVDLNIKEKGSNDRIVVKVNPAIHKKRNPRQIIINGEEIDGHSLTDAEVKKIWATMSPEEREEAYMAGQEDELPDAHFPEDQRYRAELASQVSDIDKLEQTKVGGGDEKLSKYYATFGVRYGEKGTEGLWTHYMQVIRPYTEQDYAHYYNHLLDGMMRGDLNWFGGKDFSSDELFYYQGTPFEKLKESEKKHAKKEIRELMDSYYSDYPETRNLNYRDSYKGIKIETEK